jgi:hypothetical protein
VGVFSRGQLREGDVVTDFLDKLQLCRDADFVPAKKNYNESLDVEGALVVEASQRAALGSADMVTRVDVTQSVISHTGRSAKYFLSQAAVARIRKHFRRSNMRLARYFMGSRESPFLQLSDCWRKDSLADIEARATALAAQVDEVSKIPTLMGEASGAELASRIALSQGWSEVRAWGVWSNGAQSRILFRVYRHRLIQEVSELQLFIEGRYYAANRATRVWINGEDLGLHTLRRGGGAIVLPVTAVAAHEVLDILLEHAAPTRPAECEDGSDRRALAFGLERVAYTLSQARDA